MKHLLYLALVLIFVTSPVSCTRRSSFGDTRQSTANAVTEEDLQECSSKMHITFPRSTRPLNIARVTGGPDDALYLKIEVDGQDVAALLKQSPFDGIELRSDIRYVLKEPTLSWWDPESVSNYKSGQAGLPDAKSLNILLDLGRTEKITVYLQWGET